MDWYTFNSRNPCDSKTYLTLGRNEHYEAQFLYKPLNLSTLYTLFELCPSLLIQM